MRKAYSNYYQNEKKIISAYSGYRYAINNLREIEDQIVLTSARPGKRVLMAENTIPSSTTFYKIFFLRIFDLFSTKCSTGIILYNISNVSK